MIELISAKFIVECPFCQALLRMSYGEPEVIKKNIGSGTCASYIHYARCPNCNNTFEIERANRMYENYSRAFRK